MIGAHSRRAARLLAALGVAASLTLVAAGCASTPAASSISVDADTIILDVRTPAEFAQATGLDIVGCAASSHDPAGQDDGGVMPRRVAPPPCPPAR